VRSKIKLNMQESSPKSANVKWFCGMVQASAALPKNAHIFNADGVWAI
jgi:hypothetical protein